MKLSEMKTNHQVLAEALEGDPEFRAEWNRTVVARALANAILRFRGTHDLSQAELGMRLGMTQPQVARIECASVNPTVETLLRVSGALGIAFDIRIAPTDGTRADGPDETTEVAAGDSAALRISAHQP